MSSVHAAGKRGPGVVRAAVKIGLGCVLLGGCSAGSERFTNLELGSGYEAAPPPSNKPASTAALNAPQYRPLQQTASSQPKPQSGYQLASATPGEPGGYLQVSRVDLPPVQQQSSGSTGVKTADGYGPYGPAPLADGTYAGPRVYSPYDQPNGYAPPPPPPAGGYNPPPGGYNPPPQGYYGGPSGPSSYAPPPPPQDPGNGPYGYQQQSQNQQNGRGYDRAPQGYAYYGPDQGNTAALDGKRTARPSGPAVADASRGKVVTLAPGETLLSLASRHGVTVEAIARVNRLRGGPIAPGTRLYIPAAGPSKFAQAPAAPRAKVAECTGGQCYTVQKGETVGAIARAHGLTEQQVLEANNLPDARSLRAGQSIAIPGQTAPRQAMAAATPQNRIAPRGGHASASAAAAPEGTLQESQQVKPSTEVKMSTTAKPGEPSCEAALANPIPRMGKSFRKPVEGLVIGQFGPQRDGSVNEGLTISVPKGTAIKAAENGVVAYVGDELPGFGNLILIRHAEEYVTAYAHADEIMVKKCDVVKRGQTIATAGATGDASQPQLHFEIRKNAKPVDPSPLLGS